MRVRAQLAEEAHVRRVSGDLRAPRAGALTLTVPQLAGVTLDDEPLRLADGSTRTFLEDGDEVTITASAPGPNGRICLGEVAGRVLP